MAKIEIFSRAVSVSATGQIFLKDVTGQFQEHLYLIYTADDGSQRIIRGGPEENGLTTNSQSPFVGNLNAIEGVFDSTSKDWPTLNNLIDLVKPASVTIATGSDAELSQIWNLMKLEAATITSEQYDYEMFPGQNSNTVVHDVVAFVTSHADPSLLSTLGWHGLVLPQRDGHDVSVPGLLSSFSHDPIDVTSLIVQKNLAEIWNLEKVGMGQLAFHDIPAYLSQAIQTFIGGIIMRPDPLAIDLNGDKVVTQTAARSVYFDIDNDGMKEAISWVAPQDGLLVRDVNHNGRIDNATELFGSATQNGFAKLAELDSNHDGKIDAQDAAYAELKVWQDKNQDGISQADELLSVQNDLFLAELPTAPSVTGGSTANIEVAVGRVMMQTGKAGVL